MIVQGRYGKKRGVRGKRVIVQDRDLGKSKIITILTDDSIDELYDHLKRNLTVKYKKQTEKMWRERKWVTNQNNQRR